MKVLIAAKDIYRERGGGQTVYQKLIQSAPDVSFYYPIELESIGTIRPPNTKPLKLPAKKSIRSLGAPISQVYHLRAAEDAERLASAATGLAFDIVDIPDYLNFGVFLQNAFDARGVSASFMVIALHGTISDSIRLNWGSPGDNTRHEEELELLQFQGADAAYAISPRYAQLWKSRAQTPVTLIDPLHFTCQSLGEYCPEPDSLPNLYCIGRSERRKGNDLFIEIVKWLKAGSYSKAIHLGDNDYSYNGISSSFLLEQIARKRDISLPFLKGLNHDDLGKIFRRRSLIVLPVRYDSLNLVALDALCSGCPVAISDQAGVCEYIDSNFPGLPYIKLRYSNLLSGVQEIQTVIDNYDKYRKRLADYLSERPLMPSGRLDASVLYKSLMESAPSTSKSSNAALLRSSLTFRQTQPCVKSFLLLTLRRLLPTKLALRTKRQFSILLEMNLKSILLRSGLLGDAKLGAAVFDSVNLPRRFQKISDHTEKNKDKLKEKLNEVYGNSSSHLFRCNFWAEIARIERSLGNLPMAIVYELRILRLLGGDVFGTLSQTLQSMRECGFDEEARAISLMYSDNTANQQGVFDYLKSRFEENRKRQDKSWALMEDHRFTEPVKVSVIVSLYNAADKLELFLTALSQQTLLKSGQVEVVLVDSGSPSDEKQVFDAFNNKFSLNAVYARSPGRESIQSAWNRGIGLSRGEYLVFLGVDETLYPEALETLSDELDANPDVDWVMANSLVTAVEENGVFKHDIMTYDRKDAVKNLTYLETCYLSWVGGMYRRNIHERFGYYDETFRAAGDTEFKERILPHIKTKFINKMLGVFWNYPDGQTTMSPRAEIEDSRAWYIHRTLGGVRYAFEDRPVEEAEAMLCLSLGYRKSYCGHMSCDIDYASAVAEFLGERSTVAASIAPDLREMKNSLQSMEYAFKPMSKLACLALMLKTVRLHKGCEARHRPLLAGKASPFYIVLNDNRYEQHSWLWKSQ